MSGVQMLFIIKRNFALVFALTCWSTGVAAAECKTDVSSCSVKELCSAATTIKRGHLEWNFDSLDHVVSAKSYGLNCGVDNLVKPSKNPVDVQVKFTKNDFTVFNQLERRQIQYALKHLGYYSSSVDGLWGKGTERAVNRFVRDKNFTGNLATKVYKSLTLAVDLSRVIFNPVTKNTPKPATNSPPLKSSNSKVCRLNKNSTFEHMLRAEEFIPRAVKEFNSLREVEVTDDLFIFGSKKVKPNKNGVFTRYINIRCVDNVNGWSRCGTFTARLIFRDIDTDQMKGKLLLPSEWPLYTGQQQKLEYTCTKK